jgi:hypothetical protein
LGVALVATGTPAAHAGPRWPYTTFGIGGTAAVDGDPNHGGFSIFGDALWPVEGPWSFGFTAFVDDMGTNLAPIRGPAPTFTPFGTTETRHRFLYGGAWRLDARFAAKGPWKPRVNFDWGALRIQDDARGTVLGSESAPAMAFGFGMSRPVLQRSSLGLGVRVHRLFNERVRGYLSGGIEWGWQFGKKL